jgi:iron complex transport system ATP-binding protein
MKLRIENLEFSYPSVPVLKDICMELHSGTIVSIVGRNGAGKSTLLKCMTRILQRYKGTILLDGQSIESMKNKEIARRMAYLPQTGDHDFPVTVFDMVLMGRYPHIAWSLDEHDKDYVWQILEMMGLQELAIRDFRHISGGQQQQVLIARALAQQADVFLLDEPTSNLDIRHQLEVMEVIKRLVKENNILTVISIHDLNLAARYADWVIMINQGSIHAAGEPNKVFTAENIQQVYGVEAKTITAGNKVHIIPVRPVEFFEQEFAD